MNEATTPSRCDDRPVRHPLLTKSMEKVLQILVNEDEYIICEGLRVWVGDYRTSWKTVYRLLQLCLIQEDELSSKGGVTIYFPNSEAHKVLSNPKYKPEILMANNVSVEEYS